MFAQSGHDYFYVIYDVFTHNKVMDKETHELLTEKTIRDEITSNRWSKTEGAVEIVFWLLYMTTKL